MAGFHSALVLPPLNADGQWRRMSDALLDLPHAQNPVLDGSIRDYGRMAGALTGGQPEEFNAAVHDLRARSAAYIPRISFLGVPLGPKTPAEVFFNQVSSPGPSHRFRHDSLTLFLELIDKIAPHGVSVDHRILGDAVYFDATAAVEDGNHVLRFGLSPQLEDVANRWRMFYFHYYLSVALESLFVGVVGCAQRAGMVGTRLETILGSLKSKAVALPIRLPQSKVSLSKRWRSSK